MEMIKQVGEFGVLVIIAAVFLKTYIDDKKANLDNIIQNNTIAMERLSNTLEMLTKSNKNIESNVSSIENKLGLHDDRLERVYTNLEVMDAKSAEQNNLMHLKLDAIIRESFDKRIVNEIQKDYKAEEKKHLDIIREKEKEIKGR